MSEKATTERFQDKREAILDGAARLFNQHGIKGGLLSQLAQSVGLATNSLTYYYRKKEDLACACLQRAMDGLNAVVDVAARERELALRIRALLVGYLGLLADIAEGRHAELIVFSDLLSLAPPQREPMMAAYTQMFRRVRGLLDAPDAPRLEAAQRNARAHLLLSTVSWARAWIARHEPADYARVAAQIADIVWLGLARAARPVLSAGASASAPTPLLATEGDDVTATRVAYLRAATRLVNEYGYRGASVDRIAAELRLTKGSFYHHHETKEELIGACFERTFAVVRAAQSAALATPGSGLDRLAIACRALLDYQMSPHGPLLRVTAWTGLPAAIRDDTRRTMGRLGERFAALVVDGMRDGSLRIVDPSIAAQVINGVVNAAAELQRWVPGVGPGNAFELYAMPLFHGLQPAAAPHEPAAIAAAAR
ncbi:MAG TPA: TetR/AcrR family transcriptional regulator [Burkholderiaceae bacterium]|nr:TetR/AcrR family transcriptional regulator [Burkholderiaceae bacterium]